MARLFSDFVFSGTIGNLTIYRVGDKSYVRTKSSLDRKRFLRDPAFAQSREKAALFGKAARLVKAFYQELPKEVKRHGLFGKLTAIAYKGLQAGKSATAIAKELQLFCSIEVPVLTLTIAAPVVKRQADNKRKAPPFSKWRVNVTGRLITRKVPSVACTLFKCESSQTKRIAIPPDG